MSTQAFQITQLAARGCPLPLGVDARTGEPTGLRGTAAMIWISVWSELAQMGEWKDTALIRSALDHYREAVSSGQLLGAPEDVEGECVTSEDIYIAINAYEGMVSSLTSLIGRSWGTLTDFWKRMIAGLLMMWARFATIMETWRDSRMPGVRPLCCAPL